MGIETGIRNFRSADFKSQVLLDGGQRRCVNQRDRPTVRCALNDGFTVEELVPRQHR